MKKSEKERISTIILFIVFFIIYFIMGFVLALFEFNIKECNKLFCFFVIFISNIVGIVLREKIVNITVEQINIRRGKKKEREIKDNLNIFTKLNNKK